MRNSYILEKITSPATNLINKRQGTDADPFLNPLYESVQTFVPIMHLPVRRTDSK